MSQERQHKNQNETKLTIRIDNKLLAECDKHKEKANCKNRTEYIESAMNFFNHYLDSDEQLDYLAPILSSIIDASVKGCEEHLSRNLFKIAVELAKVSNLLAVLNELDDDTLRKLHIKCVDEVRKTNGVIRYENAVKYQQG